jgi:hypothetical protein
VRLTDFETSKFAVAFPKRNYFKALNFHQRPKGFFFVPLHSGVVLPVELRVVKTSASVVLTGGAASVVDAAWVVGAIDDDEMPDEDSAKSVVVCSTVLDSVLVSVQI